ncbi:MAG: chloride channel protein, partial [Burkholderiales bacterium]
EGGLKTLPASLIGGAVGYSLFALAHMTGFANFLKLPPVTSFTFADILYIVVLSLVGIVLAVIAGALMQAAQGFFGRFKDRIVLRALVAGVIFSIVGYFAPILMFAGESQVHTLINDAGSYGIAVLLIMAVAKLALLAVAFKSGFLGGPTFPVIFASVCVALAISAVLPTVPIGILIAGIMAGALFVLFRTPLMVILLTSFMLDAPLQLQGLIVLAVATAMIIVPPLLQLIASRRGGAPAQAG